RSARRSVSIAAAEIFSILFPRTSTLDGVESVLALPSKTRTFRNSTPADCEFCASVTDPVVQPMTRIDVSIVLYTCRPPMADAQLLSILIHAAGPKAGE